MKPTRRVQRRKQTRRKRRGGVKLGEGRDAFIVDPAIPCTDVDTSGLVSKVFKNDAQQNYAGIKATLTPIVKKLKEIDPEQTRFLYPVFCEKIGKPSDDNKADGVTDKNTKYSYLIKKGGVSLETELKAKASAGISSDEALEYLKPIIGKVRALLKELHDNGILHNDPHPGNILLVNGSTAAGQEEREIQIIDFDSATMFDPQEILKLKPAKAERMAVRESIETEDRYFIEYASIDITPEGDDVAARSLIATIQKALPLEAKAKTLLQKPPHLR